MYEAFFPFDYLKIRDKKEVEADFAKKNIHLWRDGPNSYAFRIDSDSNVYSINNLKYRSANKNFHVYLGKKKHIFSIHDGEIMIDFIQCWRNIDEKNSVTHNINPKFTRKLNIVPISFGKSSQDYDDPIEDFSDEENTSNNPPKKIEISHSTNNVRKTPKPIEIAPPPKPKKTLPMNKPNNNDNINQKQKPSVMDLWLKNSFNEAQNNTKFTQTSSPNRSVLQLGKRKEKTESNSNIENVPPTNKTINYVFSRKSQKNPNSNNPHPKRLKMHDINNDADEEDNFNLLYSPNHSYSSYNNDSDFKSNNFLYDFPRMKERGSDFPGFQNLGNTCYLNSILQTLTSVPCFLCDLFSDKILELLLNDDRKNNFQYEKESLLFSFLKAVYLKYTSKSSINLQDLKDSLTHSKVFLGTYQQDAHEFMYTFFQLLEKEIFYLSKRSEFCEKIEVEDVPTMRNFISEVKHKIICNSCNHKSDLFELFYDFSLKIPEDDSVQLENLFFSYFQSEEVERKCENCGHQKATIKHKFNTLPRILILHLKRFKQIDDANFEKISSLVKFNTEISLDKICSKKIKCTPINNNLFTKESAKAFERLTATSVDSDDDYLKAIEESKKTFEMESLFQSGEELSGDDVPHKNDEKEDFVPHLDKLPPNWGCSPPHEEKHEYQLFSIVNHRGISKEFGHYTSDVYNFNTKEWFAYDDSKYETEELDEKKNIGCEEPYIFFFVNKQFVQ